MEIETKMLDDFLEDIQKLKEAKELLNKIWRCLGPYDLIHVLEKHDPNLVFKIRDFYGFDDSE